MDVHEAAGQRGVGHELAREEVLMISLVGRAMTAGAITQPTIAMV